MRFEPGMVNLAPILPLSQKAEQEVSCSWLPCTMAMAARWNADDSGDHRGGLFHNILRVHAVSCSYGVVMMPVQVVMTNDSDRAVEVYSVDFDDAYLKVRRAPGDGLAPGFV